MNEYINQAKSSEPRPGSGSVLDSGNVDVSMAWCSLLSGPPIAGQKMVVN